jgi:hypothetical protein
MGSISIMFTHFFHLPRIVFFNPFLHLGENWDKRDMNSFTKNLAKLTVFVIGHWFFCMVVPGRPLYQ